MLMLFLSFELLVEPLMNKNWAKIVNGVIEQDSKRKFLFTLMEQ